MKLIRIFLLSLSILLASCEKKEEEKAKEIELITQTTKITFLFPAGYVKDTAGSSLITVLINYPEMTPANYTNPEARNSQIIIFIEAFDGLDKTKRLIKDALPYFDYNSQGLNFYAGKKGIYDVYKQVSMDDKINKVVDTILVFKSKEGVLVGVADYGSAIYTVNRRLNENIHLKYLIPKGLSENFPAVDTAITNFVNLHIKNGVRSNNPTF